MEVKLRAVTQPVGKLQEKGIKSPEDFIVYCARVSNPNNQFNTETNEKLINYCIQHQHWSIFEQVYMTFEIETSRAIAAQILRHRSFTFQEFSQRYSNVTRFEEIEWRKQGKTNRQVGDKVAVISPHLQLYVNNIQDHAMELYTKLIQEGIAKECARMVLPLSTGTTLYMTGSVRSFIHYIQLRTKEDTQKEHRDIALDMKNLFIEAFPTVSKALNWLSEIEV